MKSPNPQKHLKTYFHRNTEATCINDRFISCRAATETHVIQLIDGALVGVARISSAATTVDYAIEGRCRRNQRLILHSRRGLLWGTGGED